MRTDYDYIVDYHLKNGKVKRDNYGSYTLCLETSRLNFECNKDITDYYTISDYRSGLNIKCLYDSRNDNENLDLAKEMLRQAIKNDI